LKNFRVNRATGGGQRTEDPVALTLYQKKTQKKTRRKSRFFRL